MIILKGIAALIIIIIFAIYLIVNLIANIIKLFEKDAERIEIITAVSDIVFTVAVIIYFVL